MNRALLFLIALATPKADREWVVGDTIEEFAHLARSDGPDAARRWLRGEVRRVLLQAPRHRVAVRHAPSTPRHVKGDRVVSAIAQDLRYALRLMKRSPGFSLVAVATLALGIGANTAMFSVVNAVLLKPLPFKDADRLMLVHLLAPDLEQPGTFRENVWSFPKYRTFTGAQDVFEDSALFGPRDFTLSGDGEPERVRGEVVTDRYPAVLGIEPVLGRSFTFDEAHAAGPSPVAMIGHSLWTRRFGADPSVLGRTIHVNATPYTIVGVLPRGFRGLIGVAEAWVPLGTYEPSQLKGEFSHSYYLAARRKPDVPEQAAIAAVRVLGGRIEAAHPNRFMDATPWGATAASLYASRADSDVRRASFVLLGAVGFVLLIACVNLTNLVIAKAIARRREVAVRVALGASRARIVRQFLAEGSMLAAFGAIGGLALTAVMLNAAAALLPEPEVFFRTAVAPGTPRTAGAAGLTRVGAAMIGLDAATLLFTCGIAILTAILVSLIPAVQASLLRPAHALKRSGSAVTAKGLHSLGARAVLVSAQIALALVLLAGAGLMIKSAARLQRTSIGVTPDHVLTVRVDLPAAAYTRETGSSFYDRLLERVRAVSGVEAAALANCPPVSGGCNSTTLRFFPPRASGGMEPIVGVHWVTPELFPTLGIQLQQGRHFTDRDRAGQPKVVLVNEAAARALWPNDSPIGKRIGVGQGGFHDGAEVVGVVSDVRYRAIETTATPDVYLPLAQSYQSRMRLFVRSRLDTRSLVAAIGREVRALDRNLPLTEIKTMEDRVGDAMWRTRVGAWLLSAFAALALLLTAIGIFGVMAQTVMQRTAEIGIRMALGAQARDVLRLVLGRAALITMAGLAIGIGAALVLTRVIAALLYGVDSNDPGTFVLVAAVLGVVALAACYVPARRATRVDAMVALRSE